MAPKTWEQCALAGMTVQQAALALERTASSGRKYAKIHGIKFKLQEPKGVAAKHDAEITRLLAEGHPYVAIARQLHLCRHAVRNRARSLGLMGWKRPEPPKPKTVDPRIWREDELDFVRDNYLDMSDSEMAEALGNVRTASTIKRMRIAQDLPRDDETFGANSPGPTRPKKPRGITRQQREWAISHFNSDNPALREEARMIAVMAADGRRLVSQ